MQKAAKKFTIFFIVFGLISSVLFFRFGWFDALPAQAAAPTVVNVGAVANGINAITPDMPAGVQTNDILLLFIETADQAITVSGGTETWTQIANSPVTGVTGTRLTAFWARASQYNPTSPTTADSGNHQLARMIAFRGAIQTGNPWDVVATDVENTSDTSVSFPSVTTTVADTLIVMALAGDGPDNNSTANFSGWTNASLTSLTEYIDNRVNSGNGGLIGAASGIKAAAGATGATTATLTNDAVKAMMTVALKPDAPANSPPTLSISQPDGVGDSITQGDLYAVTYSLADTDNTVTAAFYYDTDSSGLDGTAISGACATAAEGSNVTCSWNTTGVTPGSYFIYGITTDGVNSQVSAYSTGTITINAPANSPPTLSISQPDGVGDGVTQGDSFNVTYTLADTDNIVTAAFSYDANSSGLDGTAISGACATAAEGSNVTCSWNTTGVTPGSYYVYGITSDGVNPQVSAYSGGTITINAPAVISVDSITPNAGALAGGTSVTISGSNFQSGAAITFDGISATDIVFVDSGTLTAKTPAHATGAVDVVVTNLDLASDTLVSGYTYTAAAVVTLNASPLSLLTGESFVMSWTTENAATCSASGAWSGAKATSGNETIAPASIGTHLYMLECTGTGGSGSDSVTVVVSTGGVLKEPGTLFRFDGFAYPDGKIFLYDNNAPFSQLLNDVSGRFATSFRLMSLEDKHVFSVIAYDREGNVSPSKTFPSELYERGGLTDILIAPTITLHKRALGNNETLRISGYATPGNKVQVEIDGRIVGTVPTIASGYYALLAPLSSFTKSGHMARALQITVQSRTSDYSLLKAFQISEPFAVHADLNNDGKLTVSDWSIFLSSWISRDDIARKKIDFNSDGRITIFDLSVFLSSFRK